MRSSLDANTEPIASHTHYHSPSAEFRTLTIDPQPFLSHRISRSFQEKMHKTRSLASRRL